MNLFFLSTIFFIIPVALHYLSISRIFKLYSVSIRFFTVCGIKILLTLLLFYLTISLSIFLPLFLFGFKLDQILWFLFATIPAPISSSGFAFIQLPKAWNHVFKSTIKPFTTFFDSLDVSDVLEEKATLFVEAAQDFVNAVGNHFTPQSLNVEVDVYSLNKPIYVQVYRIFLTILHLMIPYNRTISFDITAQLRQTFSEMIKTFNDVLDVTDLSSILPEMSLSENCFTLFTPLKKSVKMLLSSQSLDSIVAKLSNQKVVTDAVTQRQLENNLVKSLKAFTNQCDIVERVANLNKNSPEVEQNLLKLREIASITELRDMFIGRFKTYLQEQLTAPGLKTYIIIALILLICAILKFSCLWMMSRNGIRIVTSNPEIISSRKAPLIIVSITGAWFAFGETFLLMFFSLLLCGLNLLTSLSAMCLLVHAFALIPTTAGLQRMVYKGIGRNLSLKFILSQTAVSMWWWIHLNFLLVFIMTGSFFGKLVLALIDGVIISVWEKRYIDDLLINSKHAIGSVV